MGGKEIGSLASSPKTLPPHLKPRQVQKGLKGLVGGSPTEAGLLGVTGNKGRVGPALTTGTTWLRPWRGTGWALGQAERPDLLQCPIIQGGGSGPSHSPHLKPAKEDGKLVWQIAVFDSRFIAYHFALGRAYMIERNPGSTWGQGVTLPG